MNSDLFNALKEGLSTGRLIISPANKQLIEELKSLERYVPRIQDAKTDHDDILDIGDEEISLIKPAPKDPIAVHIAYLYATVGITAGKSAAMNRFRARKLASKNNPGE